MDFAWFRFACFLCVGLATFGRSAPLTNVSNAGPECLSGAGGSYQPSFSEDGRFIVFLSHANNLVTNDDSGLALDVFLAEISGQSMELISVNRSGTGGGNADSMYASAWGNGTMVVFGSRSSNLTTNDDNNAVDLYLRSRSTSSEGETRLITTDRFGGNLLELTRYSAKALSAHPKLRARPAGVPYVVFQSLATNIAALRDTNRADDIFIFDPVTEVSGPVSFARHGNSTGDGSSHSPQVVALAIGFISTATNLHTIPPLANTNRGGDIYVVDDFGVTHWASPNTRNLLTGPFPAPPSTYTCFNFALNANGAVAYQANAGQGSPAALLYTSLGATSAVLVTNVSDIVGSPQITHDGDVVYSSRSNIYVWNSTTRSNILVSANTNGLPANGPSHSPVLGRFGEYVVFVSRATDLVTNAPSGTWQIYARGLNDGITTLVTVSTNGRASQSDFEYSNIALPQLGTLVVAFDSTASDLVAGDLNGQSDVFIRDFNRNETRLISRRHGALPARTAPPMSGTAPGPASVSADGRFIAFTSTDNPAAPTDTNIWQDVFVGDTLNGTLQTVTRGSFSPAPQAAVRPILNRLGTHASYALLHSDSVGLKSSELFWRDLSTDTNIPVTISGPVIQTFALNSSGHLLVFESNGRIVSREMPAGPTNIISLNYSGSGPANNVSSNLVLSPNDRWVAFQSDATDIVNSDPFGGGTFSRPRGTLYVRDLLSNTSKVASITASSVVAVRGPAVFSADSEWIGYVVTNREIYVRQLTNNVRTNVCSSCDQPSLSQDASFVAYQTLPTNGPSQICVKNMRSGVTKLISASVLGAEANGPSTAPQITADGRFVLFQSAASDLVENDNNNASDIFLGDRVLGNVLLLSINRMGTGSGNGASSKAVLSADGRTVVFQSLANDLVAGDYNDRRDVFVATLALPDSDDDGMDDDFEVTYFGNLERDGAGDMDNDGHTDQEEFLAGTNPTDNTSILRVVSITAPGNTARQLVWSSTPGRTYFVQFKDALADNWSTLPGSVRASASTAAVTDESSDPRRFYRVLAAE